MTDKKVRVRVLFADGGAFHHEDLSVSAASLEGYDRLIDGLREDPDLLKSVYVDVGRLCAAWLVEEEG